MILCSPFKLFRQVFSNFTYLPEMSHLYLKPSFDSILCSFLPISFLHFLFVLVNFILPAIKTPNWPTTSRLSEICLIAILAIRADTNLLKWPSHQNLYALIFSIMLGSDVSSFVSFFFPGLRLDNIRTWCKVTMSSEMARVWLLKQLLLENLCSKIILKLVKINVIFL